MEPETKTSPIAEAFLDLFEDKTESGEELSKEDRDTISAKMASQNELEEGLPLIKEHLLQYKEKIDYSDKNIKQWQKSKKFWANRQEQLLSVLGSLMDRLHIPGMTLKTEGAKLSTSSRTSLEVDEDWLIQQYQTFADELQKRLPSYVTVKLSIDKNKLGAHLKTDNSLLLNNPDRIHTKTSRSVTLK